MPLSTSLSCLICAIQIIFKPHKVGSAAHASENQMQETDARAKERGLFRCRPGRMVGFCLRDHLIYLFKPMVLIGIGSGRLSFSIQPSCYFLVCSGPSIHFPAFGVLSVRTAPCAILASCGDSPALPQQS